MQISKPVWKKRVSRTEFMHFMTTLNAKQPSHPKPRWLLVLMAVSGSTLGWLAMPSVHQWLGAVMRKDGWTSWLAVFTLASIYWVLARAAVDLVTDVYGWRHEGRHDRLRGRLTIVDGRFGWAPTILMFWTNIEVLIALITIAAFIVASFGDQTGIAADPSIDDPWEWWQSFIGWSAIALAGYSVLLRSEAAIFPLPDRWLEFARDATEQEARESVWPWSKRRSENS